MLATMMASPFGMGSSWRRVVEKYARLVVQTVSAAIWVEGMPG